MSDDNTTPLGPWPGGLNNRLPARSVPDELLRDAFNVDLDNSGRPSRRAGLTRLYRGIDCHGLLSCPGGVYGVDNGVLGRYSGEPPALSFTPLVHGVGADWTAYYLDGWLYWSDGAANGRLDCNDRAWPWGVPVPAPAQASSWTGSLPAGRYLLWLTARLENGEESGASEPVAVDLAAPGGLWVRTPALAGVALIGVYLTTTNGGIGYLMGLARPGEPLYIVANAGIGKPSEREVFGPPPAGNLIRYHRGRLYVVAGNTVYYSDAYAYGRFRPQSQYRTYPAPITVFEPVTDGIWCVADQTYWHAGGNPAEFQDAAQLDYGAIAGTGAQVPNSNDVMWMSTRGAILAMENGQLKNLQEDQVAVSPGTAGAGFIREQAGLRQFIAAYAPSGENPLVARDWIEARIVPK